MNNYLKNKQKIWTLIRINHKQTAKFTKPVRPAGVLSVCDVSADRLFPSPVEPKLTLDMIADELLCVRAGDPFKIPVIIAGRPVPKVTWDFDGKAKKHKKNKLHTLPVDSEVRPALGLLQSVIPHQIQLRSTEPSQSPVRATRLSTKHKVFRTSIMFFGSQ